MRARAACRRAEGLPAYYRLDTVDVGPVGTPHGVAVGADGTLYVADTGGERNVARPRDGVAQTLATTPGRPYGVAVDRSGTIYAALRRMHEVIRVAPDGSSTAFAGTGIAGQSGGGGPAIAAETVAPNGVAVDAQGNVYITQSAITSLFFGLGGPGPEERVRVVDQGGTIRTVAGSGAFGTDGVGGPALAAQLGAVNSHCQCATDSRAFSLKMRHQLPEDPSRFSATGSGAGGGSGDSVRGLPRIR